MPKDYLSGKQFNKEITELLTRVITNAPFIIDAAASEIAELAIECIKENIELGNNMAEHSEHTPELTQNLSGKARGVGSILEETGELKNSVYVVDKLLSRDGVYIVIGSDLPYAAYHEEGLLNKVKIPGVKGAKSIPARPFIRPGMEKAVKKAFRYGLESRIRKAFKAALSKKSWKKFF